MKLSKQLGGAVLFLLLSCYLSLSVSAQSIDQTRPTPVQSNDVFGTIHARDIGDARLTDHFYAFIGNPGDVLITVEGKNLNGDVDVFTASGMRPLLKFALYAGSVSPVTKGVYLRTREDLILRVQARTPDDDDGSYRLRFGGSFEPITSGPLLANAEPTPEVVATVPKGRRVTSAGARIYEPPEPEVAVAPTPEPTPEVAEAKPTPEETKPAVEPEAKPTPPRTTPRRAGRRQPGRRTRTPQPVATEPSTTPDTTKPAEETAEAEPKPPPTRRGSSRRTAAERRTEQAAAAPQEPETGPRLIIETNDGTLINRYMSSVRRVTVERNLVVVTGKDGKIERIPLDTIVRMTIAP